MMASAGPQKEIDFRRLSEVIKDFLSKYQYLYEKRIQKLVFYGEMYCLVNFERRLTDATFVPYLYGSFSEDVHTALEELANRDEVPTKTDIIRGKDVTRYIGDIPGGDLDNRVHAIIDRVHMKTRHQSTDELAKVSKQNWLYEHTPYGDPMKFREFLNNLDDDEFRSTVEELDEGLAEVKREELRPALFDA